MATTTRVFLCNPGAAASSSALAAATFGDSMFDAVRISTTTARETAVRPHYERRSVRLDELCADGGGAAVVVCPSAGSLDGRGESSPPHLPVVAVGSWDPLPFARAVRCPSLLSTDCPTVGLARLGWYDDEGRRPRGREYVRLGVVGAVLDGAGRVLLTRRSSRMRSFPRAWVMPGGGVDRGETLADAAAREIEEETGVRVSRESISPMGLWESAYPTSAEECVARGGTGLMAHYLVVFCIARARAAANDDDDDGAEIRLELQEEETDAAAWLSPEDLKKLLRCPLGGEELGTIRAVEISDGVLEHRSLPLDQLAGIYPRGDAICGIAQGNLFMLEELLSAGDGTTFGVAKM